MPIPGSCRSSRATPSTTLPSNARRLGRGQGRQRQGGVAHQDGKRVLIAGLGKRDELDAETARTTGAAVAGEPASSAPGRSRGRSPRTPARSWRAPCSASTSSARFKAKEDDNDDYDDDGVQSSSSPGRRSTSSRWSARGSTPKPRTGRGTSRTCRRTSPLPPSSPSAPPRSPRSTSPLEIELIDREGISRARRWACLRGGGAGHLREPRLIVLRYTGGGDGPHLGFVGKAVTFDTGGISIKPSGKMRR